MSEEGMKEIIDVLKKKYMGSAKVGDEVYSVFFDYLYNHYSKDSYADIKKKHNEISKELCLIGWAEGLLLSLTELGVEVINGSEDHEYYENRDPVKDINGYISVRYGKYIGYRIEIKANAKGSLLYFVENEERGVLKIGKRKRYRRGIESALRLCKTWVEKDIPNQPPYFDDTTKIHDTDVRALRYLDSRLRQYVRKPLARLPSLRPF